jgi:hypothetical protein
MTPLALSDHDDRTGSVGGQASARLGQARECDAVALARSQIRQVPKLLDESVGAAMERARSAPAPMREIISRYAHALCVEDNKPALAGHIAVIRKHVD